MEDKRDRDWNSEWTESETDSEDSRFPGVMSRTPLEAGACGAHLSAFGAKSFLSFLQKGLESKCQAFWTAFQRFSFHRAQRSTFNGRSNTGVLPSQFWLNYREEHSAKKAIISYVQEKKLRRESLVACNFHLVNMAFFTYITILTYMEYGTILALLTIQDIASFIDRIIFFHEFPLT